MNVCICGGGSLGHVCAGVLASQKDVCLNIYTGHPENWLQTITVTDLYGKQYVARINKVSNDPKEVVAGQDIILFCLPGFAIEKALNDIKHCIGNAVLGSVVSSTGFFFFAHNVLKKDAKLFGFQRVPFISRVVEYGKTADLLGYKSGLVVAVEGLEEREAFRRDLERLFLAPVRLADNYLEVSLTNSNPILHTGRLYTLFRGREDYVFKQRIFFYKDWTDEASQKLIEMDQEFFNLLELLKVKGIPKLLEYYESKDAGSLTDKISSIPAFQTILCPMVEVDGGWMVDYKSRYFTEDFPFGLRWIKELARKYNLMTPVIDEVLEWGMRRLFSF